MSSYYMFVDQQYGPYDLATIQVYFQQGLVTKDSWVFLENETTDWTRAEEIPSLNFLFIPSSASPPKQTMKIPVPTIANRFGTGRVDNPKRTTQAATHVQSTVQTSSTQKSESPPVSAATVSQKPMETKSVLKLGFLAKLKNLFRRSPVTLW